MSNSVPPYGQAPLSMGFSSQEYWSGLSFPLPGDLPDGGIESRCLKSPALAGGFFTNSNTPVGKTLFKILAMELWQRRRKVEFSSYHSTDSWLLIANPMDCGAWWATVRWVAQSRVQLKQLYHIQAQQREGVRGWKMNKR